MTRLVKWIALAALLLAGLGVLQPKPAQAGWFGMINSQPRYGYYRQSHVPPPYTMPWYTAPVFDYPPPFIYPYYMYPPYAFYTWPPGASIAPSGGYGDAYGGGAYSGGVYSGGAISGGVYGGGAYGGGVYSSGGGGVYGGWAAP